MKTKVIGIVGDIGSGKDAVLKYLNSKYGIPYLSTGDIVRKIAECSGVEPNRDNLEEISQRCFADLGEGCFVRMVAEEIMGKGWGVAGISGIRSPYDVDVMRSLFGKDFILIKVEINDPQIRFERLRKRHEERDPDTYEQFQTQDKNEKEIFQLDKTRSLADYSLSNDKTISDLHREIDDVVARQKLFQAQSR